MARISVGWKIALATALASAAALAGIAGPAAATPPCPPMEYAVAYSAPAWSVTVLNRLELRPASTWYLSPWNGTYESLAGHIGRPASAGERVTLQDTDGSGNLTASDVLQVWDPDVGLHLLTIGWGANASTIGMTQGITLQDGYRAVCQGPPRGLDPLVAGTLLVGLPAAIAVCLLAVLLVRRRRRRVQP